LNLLRPVNHGWDLGLLRAFRLCVTIYKYSVLQDLRNFNLVANGNLFKEKQRDRARDLLDAQESFENLVDHLIKEFDVFLLLHLLILRYSFEASVSQ
jgi:hypothetical protein